MRLKILLFALCLMGFAAMCNAQQKSTTDASGNIKIEKITFASEQEVVSHFKLTATSNTVTTAKGETFKMYTTPKGARCYIKKNAKGNYVKTSVPKVQLVSAYKN